MCPEVSAAKAGEDIFAQGGNAVDAAVAAAFVQGVETPLFCGIGGGISLYYRDGKSGEELYVKAESHPSGFRRRATAKPATVTRVKIPRLRRSGRGGIAKSLPEPICRHCSIITMGSRNSG